MKRKKKKKPVERTLLKPFSSLSEVCRLETESNVRIFQSRRVSLRYSLSTI